MPADLTLAPTVLVLAAGRGERFRQSGGRTHKLHALLGGVAVLDRVLAAVAASGLPHHVVHPVTDGTAAQQGMGDSIARGVAATSEAAGWLILPGDLALVSAHSLRAVAHALQHAAVVQPVHGSTRGHPVGFARECGPALQALRGDAGAAAVLQAYRARGQYLALAVDDPGIATDIDTVDDLSRAQALLDADART